MKFDIDSARKAGYSDNEIAEYLASENKFDLSGAIESGYSARDVIDYLSAPRGGKQDLPADVTPSTGRSATPMGQADPRLVKQEAPKRTLSDVALDTGITLLKGAIGLPEAFVGLADIPTQGRIGKFLEEQGYRPREAKEILDTYLSEAQQAANRKVQQAEGFVPTVKAALENPSTIATAVGESVPQMLGGAGIARGLIKAAPKVAPVIAGAVGEGAIGAGSAAEQIRGENQDGLLTAKQSAAALGSGVGTALLGVAGGRVAQKLGFNDIDTMLAAGKGTGGAKSVADFTKRVAAAGITEGALEEMPQSAQEQMWQNYALDKPLLEGVGNAAGMGLVTGAAMGIAGGGAGSLQRSPASQIARAMDQEIANTDWATPASEVAADLMSPNAYDQRLISPAETTRPATTTNFTPADSPAAEAGLVPIVVPVPDAPVAINPSTEQEFGLDKLRMGATNVGTGSVSDAQPSVGGVAGGNQLGGGVDLSGSDVTGTAGAVGGRAGEAAANAGQALATGGAAAQQSAGLTPQQNNNADTSLQPWAGRSKIGYASEQDAEQAKATASAVLDTKDTHDWRVERMQSGRYQLVPYFKESTLGTQAPQAQQAETQGQEARAGAGTVAATGAAAAPAQLQGGRVPGLTPAPTAPLRDFATFQKAVAADGIEIAPVRASEMNTQHQIASAVARVLGKTYTVARVTSGDPLALSNGMVDKLGGKHIVAAENSDDAPLFVAIHEAYHGLPAAQRKALNTQLLQLFKAENKDRFLKEFNYTEAQFEEEAPAFMAQVISKRADFWEELRTKMGNREFADVAKLVLGTLNQILRKVTSQYGEDFADTYISDIVKARDVLTTAYAEAMQAQGLTADTEVDTGVMASNKSDIGAKLQERVDNDFDALVQEYNALRGTDGGRILDTDVARELSPEYRADRSRSAEVHEAASAFIQKLFDTRMATPHNGDTVVIMAGGGGSGKSSAKDILGAEYASAGTVLDGTLSNLDKARRNIQRVLDSGRTVSVMYVYREPVEALRNGVLTRAMRAGRTVPIDALVKAHAGASDVMRQLAKDYAGSEDVAIRVIDNSRGPGRAVQSSLENITPVIKSGLKERFTNATEEEFNAGRISETVYRATIGDAGAAAQVARETAADDAGSRREAGQGRGPEGSGNPVSKDEAVVDGVVYSSKRRNLVDIPTIEFKDLVDKKVVGIKADLTDAGRSYTGIDGSQLEFPVEMMGGPNYVRLPENAKANVVWAVRGGATLTKILSQVSKADYVLVHAMNGNSHLTNSTISTAYLQTVEAYLRDGRISRENLLALDEIVRSPKNKSGLPDFPGFESPEIYSYIDGLSFDQRGALAQILEKKEAQVHGLPNLERFRRETIDSDFAGYRQGDAMLVIKVDKENPTVKLGEEGTKLHPSYPLGLRGTVVGKLAKGINYEMIFRDYFKFAVPNFKNGEAGAWYAFDRKMPIQKITKEIAESVAPGGYSAIKTARQAEAALALANGNWLVSGKTKAQGGVSVQEFVDALRANDGAAALTMYTPEEVKAGIKDKSFTVYQLGKQGGDKGLQVFFGLKRGAPWYKDMIEGVSDNEVEVVSVTNNESGAPGIGIPAIITKAISEGATVLDAFAVKSDRFPSGFLPEMYSQFGFEEIGRIPFDASFYDATQMADLKAFWSRGGWKESDGYPDVVVMRWKGNEDDRATAVERYARSGATGVSGQPVADVRGAAAQSRKQRNGSRAAKGGTASADAVASRGNQGAGNAASVVTRAYSSIQELATLGDGDIRNLGLDPAEVQRLRDELAGVQRSTRSAELARGPGARPDAGDGSTFTGIHYGKAAGLRFLSGTSFGTGIKGAEQARLAEPGVDPRIKKRVYFYLTNNNADMPRPEIGLGSHVYRATLGNLYDPSKASPEAAKRVKALMQGSGPNAFESAVLDAGFRGYVNREQGTAVVLNADVPVAYEGMADASRMRDRVIERVQQGPVTRTEGDELVRRPSSDEMGGIIKARPALAAAAPSFKLQFGEARVLANEAAEADRVLAEAGAAFQFGDVMRSQRAFHGTHARGITKFSTDKIGTGEGNQSFGWGLYFASKRDIAEYYRRTLSEARSASLVYADGTPVPFLGTGMDTLAATWLAGHQGDYAEAEASIRVSYEGDDLAAILEELKKLQDAGVKGAPESVGQLYEVDIPEDSEMLLWDQPLSEQPEFVTEQLRDVIEYEGAGDYYMRALNGQKSNVGMSTDGVTGQALYKRLTEVLGSDKAASEALLASGIKGIKYLDASSRGQSGGTSNYVVFSDDDVAIQEVYYSRRTAGRKDSWFIGRDELGRPTLGAGAKAYRVAADLANNVLARVAMKPISKDLSRAMRKMKMEIEQARLLTADAADHLSKLDENERAMISDVIEGELKRGVKPPKRVLEVAASMQGIMSEQTAELVRLGMLSVDAAGRWDGKYLPRFYESKLMDEGKKWVKAAKSILGRPKTMQGIKGSSLKGRGLFQTVPVEELEQWLAEGWQERDPKFNPDTDTEITIWRDYTREERENMGEIRDAMFRFVMGYTKSQQDIALGRLYEQLANTVASKHEQEGYVQVPSSNVEDTKARRYGKLAGKWVPQEVMDHLSATDNSMQSDVMKFYMKALSMWKEGKTVLNPVSHANNVLSNLTAAHFAGVSYWDVHKYVGATRDLVKNAGMVQEAQDAGLFGGTMTQAELVDMLPDQLKVLAAKTESKAGQAVEGVWNAMSFWLRKPLGKAYEAEDLFFRYLIYRDARQRGLEPDDAVDYAQKFIFTYDDLPKGARMVRNFALPFFSYTYKVVPMLAQTALETPWRYLAPAAAIYTANAIAYAFAAGAGEDDDDWMSLIKRYVMDPDFRAKAKAIEEDERKNLPSWMKGASLTLGTSKSVRLGVDEATDLPVFLDVSRMFPGGDLFDAQNNAGGVPLLAPITPSNPLLTTASAILFNKDSFTGKEVVKKTDTSAEAAAKRAEWAWKQFTPAIAVGNYHFDRAMNVIANVTGEPVNLGFKEYTGVGRDGTPVQPGYAAMQTVGIKARPIDLELSAKIDKSQTDALIRDIDSQIRGLRRLNNKGAISDAAMEKETDTLREKRQRLKEGLTVDGEEK